MNMHPLGFIEYLMAVGRDNIAELLQQKPQCLSETVHHVLRQELYRFL